jgi:hypothetical protein
MTPVQAVKSMAAIRAVAKERGWNTELSTRYAGLEAIAKSGGQNVKTETNAGNDGAGVRGAAPVDSSPSGNGSQERDAQLERDTGSARPLVVAAPANPVDDRPATSEPPADLTPGTGPEIADIRERAAVLRGVPQDSPPVVEGVSLKWDAKEKGFIFSRKHKDKVQKAVGSSAKPSDAQEGPALGAVLKTDGDRTVRDPDAPDAPAPAMGETKTEDGYRVVRDAKGTVIYTPSKIGFHASSRNLPEAEAQRIIEDARRPEVAMKIAAMAKKDVPSAKEITAAAKEADPDPTDAQKEAGNYAMGHIMWNGLDITIETPDRKSVV